MTTQAHNHLPEEMISETPLRMRTLGTSRSFLQFLQWGWSVSAVKVGDRFRKPSDQFGKVWEVTRIWKTGDDLLHVRLVSLDGKGETRIVSVITLMDMAYFLPVLSEPNRPLGDKIKFTP